MEQGQEAEALPWRAWRNSGCGDMVVLVLEEVGKAEGYNEVDGTAEHPNIQAEGSWGRSSEVGSEFGGVQEGRNAGLRSDC